MHFNETTLLCNRDETHSIFTLKYKADFVTGMNAKPRSNLLVNRDLSLLAILAVDIENT